MEWRWYYRRGTYLAAREPACRSKEEEGGLGILNMENQNTTLLLKFLDKFYNNADIPWVQLTWTKLYSNTCTPLMLEVNLALFWWKDVLNCLENSVARLLTTPTHVLRWILENSYPRLFSFARNKNCSLKFFIDHEINNVLCLPLTTQASTQLGELQDMIIGKNWNHNVSDSWTYSRGSAQFCSKQAYSILQGSVEASPLFSWVWKSGNLGMEAQVLLLAAHQGSDI